MSEAAKHVHEAGRSGRTSVEEPRCCCRLGTVRGVGTNGSKPPMEVATEIEGEANRMERLRKRARRSIIRRKRSTGTDHVAGVVKMTRQGSRILTMAGTVGEPRTEQGHDLGKFGVR